MSNIIDSIQLSGVTYTLSAETSGGGKAIEAGRGISITTGETADTISFSLPISAGTGTNSIVEGHTSNKASGNYSHAEGRGTSASGYVSHAEGYYTTASGLYSHAEGNGTKASGSHSHAEGYNTSASNYSHSEGYNTNASGINSHAEGQYTETTNQSEHASGQYNVSSSGSSTWGDSGNTLFSVGNGDWSGRHNAFEIRQNGDIYLSSGGTDIKLQDHLGGGGSVTVDTELDSGSTNPVENRVIYNKIDEVEEVTAAGLNALNDKITPTVELTQAQYDALVTAGTVSADTYYIITDATAFDPSTKVDTSAFTAYSVATNTALNNKVDKSAVVSSVTSASTDSEIPTAKAVWEAASGGGTTYTAGRGISIANDTISFSLPISADTNNNFIYGSTTNTVDNNSVVNYNTLIGTGNTITHTGSLVPKMYENIIYGERNTISFKGASATEIANNLILGFNNNIGGDYGYNKGYGRYNIVCGYSNGLNKSDCSFVHGWVNSSNGNYQFLNGYYLQANNNYEATFGQYNVSNSATTTFGNSGNTLFSVGNGTSARHNAFEIRQNGDIYLSSGGTDIKLQDHLGGGGTVDQTIISGSTNAVAGGAVYNKIDEIEQVTAAGLNAVNDKFDGLKLKKLTQVEYDALSGSTDANTLYVIVN